MTIRTPILYVGAFLAAASIFFSLGLLSGQYDVISYIQETKTRPSWLSSSPKNSHGFEAATPEQFVSKLNLPPNEVQVAKSMVEQSVTAISATFHDVVVYSLANITGIAKTRKCRKLLQKHKHNTKAQSSGRLEQLKLAVMDSIGLVFKALDEKYSADNPGAARSRLERNSEQHLRHDRDQGFRSEVIDKYIKLNRESRLKEINIPDNLKHLGPRPHEIMIFSASNANLRDKEEAELIYQALQNRDEYAAYHGYQHVFLNLSRFGAAEYEHPCWLKLPAIQETLHKHPEVKWLWWLDMDAIIMNGQLKIEEHLLHPYTMRQRLVTDLNVCAVGDIFGDGGLTPLASEIDPDKIEFIFTHDYLTLNAGSFFLKNTPANQITLDLWGDPEFIYNEKRDRKYERREQDAFINLYHRHKNVRDRTGVYVQSTLNSYDEHNGRELQRGEHGDFVFHFAGFSNQRDTYLRMWREAWPKRILPNGELPEAPQIPPESS